MADNLSKIDTQGMAAPMTPEQLAKWKSKGGEDQKHLPMEVRPRRLFTPEYAKEMKILINEVLDEREHQKQLEGPYDFPEDESDEWLYRGTY